MSVALPQQLENYRYLFFIYIEISNNTINLNNPKINISKIVNISNDIKENNILNILNVFEAQSIGFK